MADHRLRRAAAATDRLGKPAIQGPSAAGVMARLAYEHAISAGTRAGALLKRAGLSRQQIQDRSTPLIVRSQVELVNLVEQSVGDDLLGFNLARHYDLREIGWDQRAVDAIKKGPLARALH